MIAASLGWLNGRQARYTQNSQKAQPHLDDDDFDLDELDIAV